MKITDKDRLDFIENEYSCVSVITKINPFESAIIDKMNGDVIRGKTIRQAIDTAILAMKEVENGNNG